MTLSDIRDYGKQDLLGLVGLAPKRKAMDLVLPAVGMFAVGLVVGAGLGLLFAPKKGSELRSDLGQKLRFPRARRDHPMEEAMA